MCMINRHIVVTHMRAGIVTVPVLTLERAEFPAVIRQGITNIIHRRILIITITPAGVHRHRVETADIMADTTGDITDRKDARDIWRLL